MAQATPLLVAAVRAMSVEDAVGLVRGGDNAVTSFFARKTRTPLSEKFLPVVAQSIDRLSLAERYNALAGRAARLGVLFASVPFHAFFGVALMSAGTVIGGGFYRALALPWVADPLRDQQTGGGLAWASGELPLLLVVIALLVQWSRHDERSARRDDRRADADGDADRAAYNAMLRRLATQRTPLIAQSDEPPDGVDHEAAAEVARPAPDRGDVPAGQDAVRGSVEESGPA